VAVVVYSGGPSIRDANGNEPGNQRRRKKKKEKRKKKASDNQHQIIETRGNRRDPVI